MQPKNNYHFSITGSTLKIIAILIMLIDHIGAAIVGPLRYSLAQNYPALSRCFLDLYPVLRNIGRLAFPIFCFLLVEGFTHTRNVRKYALRLFLFALISELPFDYAFTNSLFAWRHQNVFFTLLIGLLVMIGMSYFEYRECRTKAGQYINVLMQFLIAVAGLILAKELYTDYGYKGVFLIEVLYFLRLDKKLQTIFGAIAISWEATAPLAFLPIWFYHGERGRQLKYFFYWFYPVHLLILGLLRHVVFPAMLA